MKHYQIQIIGKVQGVFFRQFTKDKATELGLKGYVMNLPDDSVFVKVCGEENKANEFVNWCWQGSPLSKVKNVVWKEVDLANDFDGFEIRKYS